MNKYSDIEIQTAKNLLKEGYKWIDKKYSGTLYAYKNNPGKAYAPDNTAKIICSSYVPIFGSINIEDAPTSLESIVRPQIIDDDEKRYLEGVIRHLEGVIRPFKDKVLYITKRSVISDSTIEYISIQLAGDEYIWLPRFKKGTMYKGMEPDHRYTLEGARAMTNTGDREGRRMSDTISRQAAIDVADNMVEPQESEDKE